MDGAGSRLGENFDASESQAVIFGGKRILVNADFADGFFRRQLTATEAIDVKLASTRTGAGTGERLQGVREIVRIVGQGFQVLALQDQRGLVILGLHAHGGGVLGVDGDLLGFHLDGELYGKSRGAAGGYVDRAGVRLESRQIHLRGVVTGGKAGERVAAVRLRLCGLRGAIAGQGHVYSGDDCAGFILQCAFHRSRAWLAKGHPKQPHCQKRKNHPLNVSHSTQ